MSMPPIDPEQPPPDLVEPLSAPFAPPPSSAATAGPDEPAPGVVGARFESDAPTDAWALIALIPHEGREPPANVSEELAHAVWCAVSAPWHPALLAQARELPRIEPVESPSPPGPREIRIIAGAAWDRLPSGYRTQAEDAGAVLLESGTDRDDLIHRMQMHLARVGAAPLEGSDSTTLPPRHFLA